jgi:transcriptional regulator with XRE-family HTH domain
MLIADLHERIRQHVLAAVRSQQVTQTALAELVGMKQSHISNLLNGRRRLSIDGMDAVLNVLGLDVTRLIPMSDQTRSPKDSSTTLESVPMIQHRAAMNPTFGNSLAIVWSTVGLIGSLDKPHVRFWRLRARKAPVYLEGLVSHRRDLTLEDRELVADVRQRCPDSGGNDGD